MKIFQHRGHGEFRVFLLFLLCALCVKSVMGAEWQVGEATVPVIHITPEEARAKALDLARQDALSKVGLEFIGITSRLLSESSSGEAYDHFARFTQGITRGRIVEERVSYQNRLAPNGDVDVYCRNEARVAQDTGQADPWFKVSLMLSKSTARHGEKVLLKVRATQDAYVTIFNLFKGDSMRVVLPNRMQESNFLRAENELTIPPSGAGWHLTAYLAPGSSSADEAFLVVATKDYAPFVGGGEFQQELYSLASALTVINRWLIDIPSDRRTQTIEHFNVVK
ncbi:MAG: DUF4384 domain-containing protein [Calditrichaeota bacterium]|nr:DUF4384 domain-containing protein [Calditrichota bacterium]